jgi:hypothetical protein
LLLPSAGLAQPSLAPSSGYNPYYSAPPPPPPQPTTTLAPAYGPGYAGVYAPYAGAGGYLRGAADVTAATGQYYKDIQQARITREQSRQAAMDTQRKQWELEMEYERIRPTAPKMKAAEQASDLEWARKYAASTEIWSGRTLNILYKQILTTPSPISGPSIPIDENVRRGINLSTGTSRGSLGLLKDAGRLPWTDTLLDSRYDEYRNRVSKNLDQVARSLDSSGGPDRLLIREMRGDLLAMSGLLDGQVQDLSPSDYIGSRRMITQLQDTLKALSDPTLVRSGAQRLPYSVRTVADLVAHMRKNGLEFAPAVAVGDQPAYTSLYDALRYYEASVSYARR